MITMTKVNDRAMNAVESFYKHPIAKSNEYTPVLIQNTKPLKKIIGRGAQQREKVSYCHYNQIFFVYDVDVERFEKDYQLLSNLNSVQEMKIYTKRES